MVKPTKKIEKVKVITSEEKTTKKIKANVTPKKVVAKVVNK